MPVFGPILLCNTRDCFVLSNRSFNELDRAPTRQLEDAIDLEIWNALSTSSRIISHQVFYAHSKAKYTQYFKLLFHSLLLTPLEMYTPIASRFVNTKYVEAGSRLSDSEERP